MRQWRRQPLKGLVSFKWTLGTNVDHAREGSLLRERAGMFTQLLQPSMMEAGPRDTYSLALLSCHEGSEVSSKMQGERPRVKQERSWNSNRCTPSGKCQGICNNVTWNIIPSYLNQPAAQMFWWLLSLWLCTPGRLALTSMSTPFWEWEILERGTSYIKIMSKCLQVKFKANPHHSDGQLKSEQVGIPATWLSKAWEIVSDLKSYRDDSPNCSFFNTSLITPSASQRIPQHW